MKITPVTKEYTNPLNVKAISFDNGTSSADKNKNVFCCTKTIVKNTPIEFSNSRGNVLADIDLADCYIKNAVPAKVAFLADMDLCDAYEKSNKNSKYVSFKGAYPQYLIDQDAVEQYETTSNGIQDIANSSYCSFGSTQSTTDKVIDVVAKFLSKILP